jgi:hypothetical protein
MTGSGESLAGAFAMTDDAGRHATAFTGQGVLVAGTMA